MVAYGGEHAAHLVIASFGERYSHPSRIDHFECGGSQRLALGLEHQRAASEDIPLVAAQVLAQGGFVEFREMGARRCDAACGA